jgi:hypothetical protein
LNLHVKKPYFKTNVRLYAGYATLSTVFPHLIHRFSTRYAVHIRKKAACIPLLFLLNVAN